MRQKLSEKYYKEREEICEKILFKRSVAKRNGVCLFSYHKFKKLRLKNKNLAVKRSANFTREKIALSKIVLNRFFFPKI